MRISDWSSDVCSSDLREADQPSHRLSQGSVTAMYWTAAQLVAHHTSNGCNLHPGDLFGTGTLSGETETSFGSLLESSRGGTLDRTRQRLDSSHYCESRMPSSACNNTPEPLAHPNNTRLR